MYHVAHTYIHNYGMNIHVVHTYIHVHVELQCVFNPIEPQLTYMYIHVSTHNKSLDKTYM